MATVINSDIIYDAFLENSSKVLNDDIINWDFLSSLLISQYCFETGNNYFRCIILWRHSFSRTPLLNVDPSSQFLVR